MLRFNIPSKSPTKVISLTKKNQAQKYPAGHVEHCITFYLESAFVAGLWLTLWTVSKCKNNVFQTKSNAFLTLQLTQACKLSCSLVFVLSNRVATLIGLFLSSCISILLDFWYVEGDMILLLRLQRYFLLQLVIGWLSLFANMLGLIRVDGALVCRCLSKVPSTRIRIFLNPQLFLSGCKNFPVHT